MLGARVTASPRIKSVAAAKGGVSYPPRKRPGAFSEGQSIFAGADRGGLEPLLDRCDGQPLSSWRADDAPSGCRLLWPDRLDNRSHFRAHCFRPALFRVRPGRRRFRRCGSRPSSGFLERGCRARTIRGSARVKLIKESVIAEQVCRVARRWRMFTAPGALSSLLLGPERSRPGFRRLRPIRAGRYRPQYFPEFGALEHSR